MGQVAEEVVQKRDSATSLEVKLEQHDSGCRVTSTLTPSPGLHAAAHCSRYVASTVDWECMPRSPFFQSDMRMLSGNTRLSEVDGGNSNLGGASWRCVHCMRSTPECVTYKFFVVWHRRSTMSWSIYMRSQSIHLWTTAALTVHAVLDLYPHKPDATTIAWRTTKRLEHHHCPNVMPPA